MKKILELKERRVKLVHDARIILDKADAEKRELTSEEQVNWNKFMAEVDKLGAEVATREQQLATEAALAVSDGRKTKADDHTADAKADAKVAIYATEEYRVAFARYLRSGNPAECRALQADSDTTGGFLVTPQKFVATLIQAVDDEVFMRRFATIHKLPSAETMGFPKLTTDPADADWTAEILTGSEDSSMDFGKRELRPHPLAKLLKVSEKLIRAGAMDIAALVAARLAYKFSVSLEKAYLSGTGAQQPLGVFTAHADGISTGRDVVATTSQIVTGDKLIDVKVKVKPQYWPRSRWIFHNDLLTQVRKLKTSDLQYIWQPGLAGGDQPDTLLGRPYHLAEFAPNTFTTGKYVAVFGDFSQYWIADALDFQLKRLEELYAATNQIGFIGRFESDGAPVLEEAFARAKVD